MQNLGNPNIPLSAGTMGTNNRVANIENISGTNGNQNTQNNFGKKIVL